MSRYETYKPSGIDWIGNYPKHWEFRRLKNVCIVNKEALTDKTPFDYLIEYIDIGNTTDNGEFLELQEIEFSEAPSRARRKVEDGDTIISTVRTYLRAIAFIENPKENLIVSTGFAVLNPIKRTLVPKFLFYQVLCDSFIQRVIANSEGVSYPAISSTKLADLKLFIPSVEEQLTIANYLDDQTQKIDRLITNKKAQAEKLKELRQIEINNAVTKGLNPNAEMKDSGIEWLGKIPKHWTTKRMKDVASVRGRIGFRGYTVDDIVDEGALVIGAKHINSSNQLNFGDPEYITWEKYYESPEIMVEVGDVLIVQRGSVGKFALVEKEIGPATINPSMILLRLNTRIHPQFLFWYLLGEHMFNIIKTIVSSTAVPMISQMQAGVFRIILPPKKEQIEIANYLIQRSTAIDQLIKNIEAQIEKLQELRKIKIYEAVTGKIKVNAYAETTA
jgi:type I restriction enzyme S subunit